MRGKLVSKNFILVTISLVLLSITLIPAFDAYAQTPATINTIVHPVIPHDENAATFDTWITFPLNFDKANATSSNDGDTTYIYRQADSKWQTFVLEDATDTATTPLPNAVPADAEITSVTLYAWVKNVGDKDGIISLGCETGKSNKAIYKSEDMIIPPADETEPVYVLVDWKMDQNPATNPIRNWTSTDFDDWKIDGKQLGCGILNQEKQGLATILVTEFWAEIARPVDPVPKITFSPLDDNGELGINKFATITVEDPYANRNGPVDSITLSLSSSARTLLDPAEITLTLPANATNPNIFEIQFLPTNGPTNATSLTLHVASSSQITAQTPTPTESRTATEQVTATNSPVFLAGGGNSGGAVALEWENDVYVIGENVKIKSKTPDCSSAERVVHVWSAADSTGFDLALTDPDGDCVYTNPNLVNLSINDSDPLIPLLESKTWGFINVKYPTTDPTQYFANAFIVPSSGATPTGGTVIDESQQQAQNCDNEGGDQDSDGLCDDWETNNGLVITYDGITYTYPCKPLIDDRSGGITIGSNVCPSDTHKDIYLEMDWMHNHKPAQNTLIKVRDAFLDSPVSNLDGSTGINLHILIDENTNLHAHYMDTTEFYQTKQGKFGTFPERDDTNSEQLIHAKRQGFHWMYFAHQQDSPAQLSSGYSEVGGNDSAITMGAFVGHVGTNNQQASTIIHELGHNLFLNHGGDAENTQNCKPHYISVMNYLYQFNIWSPSNNIDLSRYNHPAIDETDPDEAAGLDESVPSGQTAAYGPYTNGGVKTILLDGDKQIDWDRANGINDGGSANINLIPLAGCINNDGDFDLSTSLTGYDDWNEMILNFRTEGTFADGVSSLDPNSGETQGKAEATVDFIEQQSDARPIPNAGPTIIDDEGEVIDLFSFENVDLDGIDLSRTAQPCGVMWDINNDTVFDGFEDSCGSPSPLWLEDDESDGANDSTGTFTVALRVNDKAGDQSEFDDYLDIVIRNVAPIVNVGSNHTIDEGQSIILPTATWEDPGIKDTHTTASINWGDSNTQLATPSVDFAGAAPVFDPVTGLLVTETVPINGTVPGDTHQYVDDGEYIVTVSVNDGDGTGNGTATVTVNNVAPTVTASQNPLSGPEGSSISFVGNPISFTDPGADTWNATVTYGDVIDEIPTDITGNVFNNTSFAIPDDHTYADNDTYTVTVYVDDGDGGIGSDSFTVTVDNVDPTMDPIVPNEQFIELGQSVSVSASFTDPGADTWTASVTYGDVVDETPTNVPGNVFNNTSFAVPAHVYEQPGNYTVNVTVTDDDLGSDSTTMTVHVDLFVAVDTHPILSPIDNRIVQQGSNLPINISFVDSAGNPIDTLNIEIWLNEFDLIDGYDPETEFMGESNKRNVDDNIADWKQGAQEYQYSLETGVLNAAPTPGIDHHIIIRVLDALGNEYDSWFQTMAIVN